MPFFLTNVPAKKVTVLGDSIPAAAGSWAYLLQAQGGDTSYVVTNRAVGGASIITDEDGDPDMDAQVVSSASDNADIIIITFGTNDNALGDMGVLQAEVEENLAELKASNTAAKIYYMNILPRSVDNHTTTRAAINAGCVAQSVVCWDTSTDPWIVPATDTSDGVHPNAAGHAKILARVLPLI